MNNAVLVRNFIEQIWNKLEFEKLDTFLHPDFTDHSLIPALSPDKEGTRKWISNTSASFEHHTIIEDQVTAGDKCMVKIRMNLTHTGPWRDIAATGIQLYTTGYRYFKFKDGKIIDHWALIDGQAIEHQLKNTSHACKIAD